MGGTDVNRRQWMVGGALALASLSGGTVAASNYPPDDPTPTTVSAGGQAGFRAPESELAATGTDSNTTLLIAGGAVAAGAGLLVAARLRRRPVAT